MLFSICLFLGVWQASEKLEQSVVEFGVKINCELDHGERKARGRQEGSNLSQFQESEARVFSGLDSLKSEGPQLPMQTRNQSGNRFGTQAKPEDFMVTLDVGAIAGEAHAGMWQAGTEKRAPADKSCKH